MWKQFHDNYCFYVLICLEEFHFDIDWRTHDFIMNGEMHTFYLLSVKNCSN